MPGSAPPSATGAELRVTGGGGSGAVVCVNGGQGRPEEGTWSVTREWLVRRLASLFPRVASGEVRYRIKSWSWMDWCEEVRGRPSRTSARHATSRLLHGGALAVRAADEPPVEGILGLAPWLPERLGFHRST